MGVSLYACGDRLYGPMKARGLLIWVGLWPYFIFFPMLSFPYLFLFADFLQQGEKRDHKCREREKKKREQHQEREKGRGPKRGRRAGARYRAKDCRSRRERARAPDNADGRGIMATRREPAQTRATRDRAAHSRSARARQRAARRGGPLKARSPSGCGPPTRNRAVARGR